MDNILEYDKLVSKIAGKYSNFSNFEDLRQAGYCGLLKALKNYKASENTKFSTYAYLWIKGEILEYLRCDRNIKISKEMLSLSKEINLAEDILRNRLNKEPTTKEIAFFLEKDVSVVEDVILSREIVLSCDYNLNDDADKDVNLYDCIPYYEKGYNPNYLDLYNEIDKLSEEDKNIIYMRYFKDMTQSEVSKKLGANQVSISRKEEKILSKLNKSLVA